MTTLNMLLAFFALHGLLLTTDNWATDTLQVKSTGKHNQVVVDSLVTGTGLFITDSAGIHGRITQTGESNSVEINTPPATEGRNNKRTRHKINVIQTGRNNSVKINSQ